MDELRYTCSEKDVGRKVYHVLRNELGLSASLVKRLKSGSGITLNGAPAFTTYAVSPGDVVAVDLISGEREPDLTPEKGEIRILYESDALIVLDKPAGMITHPSRARLSGTLAGLAAGYLYEKGCACHAVNRLDRDTSGCVMFAKSAHWKTVLARSEMKKTYLGAVCGVFEPESGVIDAPIIRAEPIKMLRVVRPDGHRAVTRYETVADRGEYSIVKYLLETGRTHQIRVHSAHLGHPLLGDRLYGTEESIALSERLGITAHQLCAVSLAFTDPTSGEWVEVNSKEEIQCLQ